MAISVLLSHKPWGFFKISLKLPTNAPPWHDLSRVQYPSVSDYVNLLLTMNILYIKIPFLSLHSLSLYKIFQFYLCEKYPSPWLFHHMKFWELLSVSKPPLLPENLLGTNLMAFLFFTTLKGLFSHTPGDFQEGFYKIK